MATGHRPVDLWQLGNVLWQLGAVLWQLVLWQLDAVLWHLAPNSPGDDSDIASLSGDVAMSDRYGLDNHHHHHHHHVTMCAFCRRVHVCMCVRIASVL